jgi:hypothetical protein
MEKIVLQGRMIVEGLAEGKAIVTREPLSFMGSVNPKTGYIIEKGHELEGRCLKGKIFVFPSTKGSTGGSYMLYEAVKQGVGPLGIVNVVAESVCVIGAIVSDLPMVDEVDIAKIADGDYIRLDATRGIVEVCKP